MNFTQTLALALGSSACYAAAFPPFNAVPLVLVALAILTFLATRAERARRPLLAVWLAWIPMWGFHHQYIWKMSEAGIFPLMAYLALYPMLYVLLISRLRRRWSRLPFALLVPIAWTGLEVCRGEVAWNGYPPYLLAHPLIDSVLVMLPLSPYTAGALCALGVGLAFDAANIGTPSRRGGWWRAGAVAIPVLAVALAPRPASVTPSGTTIRVAAIQSNVPQDNRGNWKLEQRIEDFRALCSLTRDAASLTPPPDLIVWPETMFPGNALNASAVQAERDAGLAYNGNLPTTIFADTLLELQKDHGIPMIVGARAVDGLRFGIDSKGEIEQKYDRHYNSAFLIKDGAVDERRYDKMRLTPFGEVMPYISNWEWLEQQLLSLGGRGLTFDLARGAEARCFEIARPGQETIRVATPICFETVFPNQVARLVRGNADGVPDLMLNISNDGWFAWFDGGRENCVLQARWRSLEWRLPMLRAVNTGISAAIDEQGRVMSSLRARTAGVLVEEFTIPTQPSTIKGGIADVWRWHPAAWGLFTAMTLLALDLFLRRIPSTRSDQEPNQ